VAQLANHDLQVLNQLHPLLRFPVRIPLLRPLYQHRAPQFFHRHLIAPGGRRPSSFDGGSYKAAPAAETKHPTRLTYKVGLSQGRLSEEHAAITCWQHLAQPLNPSCGSDRDQTGSSVGRRVNSSATVGTEPAGIQRYSLDTNPHTYAGFPHT
jgi:hypothetical protein